MENIGIYNMVRELNRLNIRANFSIKENGIIGNIPTTKIRFPEGYYFNEKNGITNKHNTCSGLYEHYAYMYRPTRRQFFSLFSFLNKKAHSKE